MLGDLHRLFVGSPAILFVLAIPLLVGGALSSGLRRAHLEAGRRGLGNAVFALTWLLTVIGSLGIGVWLLRSGASPDAVYVSEHEGERRVAALISSSSNRGGSFCSVHVWRLSDGRFLRSSRRRGLCDFKTDAAFAKEAIADLWAGAYGPSIEKLLETAGIEPPGSGTWQVEGRSATHVALRLQDDSRHLLEWGNGIPARRIAPPHNRQRFSVPELGVFSAHELPSDCGCNAPPCEVLIAFRNVAFGEGELFVGAVDRPLERGPEKLLWSRPTAELFGSTHTVFGALPDKEQCVLVAGRSGGRLAAAWIERQSGRSSKRWGH